MRTVEQLGSSHGILRHRRNVEARAEGLSVAMEDHGADSGVVGEGFGSVSYGVELEEEIKGVRGMWGV